MDREVSFFCLFKYTKGSLQSSHEWVLFKSLLESPVSRQNIPDLWIKILWERTKKRRDKRVKALVML